MLDRAMKVAPGGEFETEAPALVMQCVELTVRDCFLATKRRGETPQKDKSHYLAGLLFEVATSVRCLLAHLHCSSFVVLLMMMCFKPRPSGQTRCCRCWVPSWPRSWRPRGPFLGARSRMPKSPPRNSCASGQSR